MTRKNIPMKFNPLKIITYIHIVLFVLYIYLELLIKIKLYHVSLADLKKKQLMNFRFNFILFFGTQQDRND